MISTVVPQKYTITFDIAGGGSVEYEEVLYKDGDSIQVTEGTDLSFVFHADSQYKLKRVSYNNKNVTKQVSKGSIVIKNIQQDGVLAVTYTKTGSVFTPATGDNSHIFLWTVLALGSMGSLAAIALKSKYSNRC